MRPAWFENRGDFSFWNILTAQVCGKEGENPNKTRVLMTEDVENSKKQEVFSRCVILIVQTGLEEKSG